jgi:hypothetical protein
MLCFPLIVTGLAAYAAGQDYPCYRSPVAPQIDGEVQGDAAWQTIPSVTGFHALGGGYTDAKQTTAQAGWDDQALYVAMVCEEPDAAELKPACQDSGWTWGEDSVEIFLQPQPPLGPVYQLGVTAGGARGSGENSPDIAKCQAAAKIGTDSYSLEIRIPYEVLGARPVGGDHWKGAFCRNIFVTTSGGDKFTCWPPLQSRFLEPAHFATLAFLAQTLPRAEAVKRTEELNREYRPGLVKRLHEAAAQREEYKPALETARQDEQFGQEARELLDEWRRIERVDQESDQAPIPEIRQALRKVRALARASYELKYEYLLKKLFSEE